MKIPGDHIFMLDCWMNLFCIIFAIFFLFKHFEYSVAEVYRATALSVATS